MTPQGKKGKQGAAPAASAGLPGSLFHHLLAALLRWNKRDHFEAFDAFDKLVKRGCDPVFLISMLWIIAGAHRDDSWLGLTGFADPRALKTALKRLRDCADDVEKLLGGVIGRSLFQAPSDRVLPTILRGLADRSGRTVRAVTPRTNLVSRAARARIVQHVKQKSDHYLDELVASILSPCWARITRWPTVSGARTKPNSSPSYAGPKTSAQKICSIIFGTARRLVCDLRNVK